jgi:hypothetical protein
VEPVVPKQKVDNCSTIALIRNPVLSSRSKLIKVKYHMVQESAEQGKIDIGEESAWLAWSTSGVSTVRFRRRIVRNQLVVHSASSQLSCVCVCVCVVSSVEPVCLAA